MTAAAVPEVRALRPAEGMVRFVIRLLTFRHSGKAYMLLSWRHLLVGLIGTWIVGMGRWWDDPEAGVWQHLGVGSVAYVFVLSFVLFWIIRPLQPVRWRYFDVLTFVTLTSFPAIIYAIPVEKWFSADVASDINLVFLAIVAAWRVALVFVFVRRYSELSWWRTIAGVALPLMAIVTMLSLVGYVGEAISIMGGTRSTASIVFMNLSAPLALLTIFLFVAYVIMCFRAWNEFDEG